MRSARNDSAGNENVDSSGGRIFDERASLVGDVDGRNRTVDSPAVIQPIVNPDLKFWEKVRTTKITTSKTKKNSENSVDDQNIEKIN